MSAPIRVLCVDDEPRVLEGLERNLGDTFDVVTAEGGALGVAELERNPDFDVIISDMRMPQMNGAVFLGHARRLAPDAARVLLTGESDAASARAAVNEGQIFRYLMKPCPIPDLIAVVETGAEAKRRVLADRELLETTVTGSIKLLGDVLALTAPSCFRDSGAITSIVEHMCQKLALVETWKYRAAATLCNLGYIALPSELVEKRLSGTALTPDEKRELAGAPDIAARLLATVPRFRDVAEMVRRHREALPAAITDDVSRGAAMLHVSIVVLRDISPTKRVAQIAKALAPASSPVAKALLELLYDYQAMRPEDMVASLKLGELRPGMVLEENLMSRAGNVLFVKGNELTAPLLERIRQFHQTAPISEPVRVRLAA